MADEKICYEKREILRILRDLNLLVVSTDRIGSAWHDRESDEQYNAMFLRFFDKLGFFKKLAEARAALSEPFSYQVGEDGMDELERNNLGLEYWSEKNS